MKGISLREPISTFFAVTILISVVVLPTAAQEPRGGIPWIVDGEQDNAYFGIAVATAGDVNADGFSDFLVAANGYDNGETDEGRVSLYLGTASGPSTIASWSAEGDQAESYFGTSIACAGDVNGDGFDDVLIGSYFFDAGEVDEGRALLYLGSSSGLNNTPAWTQDGNQAGAWFGFSVATAGDVNGDGFDDVLIPAPTYDNGEIDEGRVHLYLGSAAGLASNPAWIIEGEQTNAVLGVSAATAGDVNADGYADVLIGSPGYSNGQLEEGRALLYLGSAAGLSTAAWIVESDQAGAFLGFSVAMAGDVDGDGRSDALVGTPFFDGAEIDEGRVELYTGTDLGLAASPSWTFLGAQEGARLGEPVSTAGDWNGDGYADFAAGAEYFDGGEVDEGAVFLFLGGADGPSSAPTSTFEGEQAGALGGQTETAGDVNGDGFSDLVVGAYYHDGSGSDDGRATLYLGSGAPPTAEIGWSGATGNAESQYGRSVSCAGDVNGDGYSDWVIGAPFHTNGQSMEGAAFLYLGSAEGLSTVPAWTAEADQAETQFGLTATRAGDVNGDGYTDLVVGAPTYDSGSEDEGRAYLYLGSPSGLSTSPDWVEEGDQTGAFFGVSIAAAGDVNADGFGDVVVGANGFTGGQASEGRAYLYLGSASGLVTSPAWTAESNQVDASYGTSVSSAGDVNGDGFSDVLVGAFLYDGGETDEGRADLYLGSASGLANEPVWSVQGNQNEAWLGNSVASAGDVNGDGLSDVLIDAPLFTNGQIHEGRASLYLGAATGLEATPTWTAEGDAPEAYFGLSVSSAGDVNGDGSSDILVGAPGYGNGESAEGRAFLYLGSPSGPSDAPDWTQESNQVDAFFGFSVASGGDVDGDGFSDVLIGSPFSSNGGIEGRGFLYLGNGGGLDRIARQARAADTAPIDLMGESDANSSFRLKARGRTAFGRGNVRLEWEVAPRGVLLGSGAIMSGSSLDTGSPVAESGSSVLLGELVSSLTEGTQYHWRARIAGDSPYFPRSPWFSVAYNGRNEADLRTGGITASAHAPSLFVDVAHLRPARPNPFEMRTSIEYVLSASGRVRLEIEDAGGRRVATLVNTERASGSYVVSWDGCDDEGNPLPPGVYFARLEALGRVEGRKLHLVR